MYICDNNLFLLIKAHISGHSITENKVKRRQKLHVKTKIPVGVVNLIPPQFVAVQMIFHEYTGFPQTS